MTADDRVNILMVDDQPDKLLTYETILDGLGENLIQARSAREALDFLLRYDIGVVLMDVSMPELDGFQLADMIRQHPRFERTAIIFISGVHLSEADKVNGYRRGAVDYIPVPVVPDVLRAKISVFVELHRKTRLLERLNSQLEQRVEERTEELRQSEQQFRTLANSIPQLAWMADADGTGIWYNQRWCDFAGVSMEQLKQTGWGYLCHPDHEARIQADLERAISAGNSWEDTFPLRSPGGNYSWYLLRTVPLRGGQGDVTRWFGTATDVTDQIEAEERIRLLNRQLEQRVTELETIMQVLPVGIAISTDPSFSQVTTNSAFWQLFAADTEPPADPARDFHRRANSLPAPFSFMKESMATGSTIKDAEMHLTSPDGSDRHLLASAGPLLEDSGKVRGAVGVYFDVSHRRRLENALRERAALLELASEAIMVHDPSGTVRYWNSGAESFYGWRREEALGQNIHSLLKTEFSMPYSEVQQMLHHLGSWRGNLVHRTADGREVIVASRMALDRETDVVLEICRDITGELRAEEALRRSEKLAAMGRTASIIAHEINNPLEAITNTFYLLRHHPSLDSEALRYANLAEQELERVSQITRKILSFYRESKQPVPLLITEVLDSVLELQNSNLQSSGITLEKRYTFGQEIYGYPGELRQVFLNLIGNAVQAMPHGGTLRLRCMEAGERNGRPRGLSVSVVDTGMGIRREDAEQLFQPFFSTKSTKGTGLGLWISKGIIEKYEGKITFKSLRFRGANYTCFRVFLPLDVARSAPASQRQDAEPKVAAAP
jgi:PAS domain S-box-containing protein